jgi:hypothetical protein
MHMEHLRRRKADRSLSTRRSAFGDLAATHPDARAWIQRCRAKLVETDPKLTMDEAADVASAMWSFERTGAMEPEAAVDFVWRRMQLDPPGKFERRSAVRSTRF